MANKLYLIRHGRTKFNKEGRLRSHKDIPLDAVGKADADKAGKRLKKFAGEIGSIHSSDLSRSKETAQQIGKHFGVDASHTAELRPWDLGSLAGQKVSAIMPLLDYYQHHPEKKVTRGEAYNDFFHRFTGHLKGAIAAAKQSDKPHAMVIHSRHALALDAALKHLDGKQVDTARVPTHGGIKPTGIIVLHLGKKIRPEVLHEGEDESSPLS